MRYQKCSLLIRLYRRLRYQPYYTIKAVLLAIRNIPYLFSSNERYNNPLLVYHIRKQDWYRKAEYYWTFEFEEGDDADATVE
jgi:hypothetical protein